MVLNNHEISSSIKDSTMVYTHDYSPGKGMHHGLIILLELAENYYSGGNNLTYICQKHKFHLSTVIPIINKLVEAGWIDFRMDNPDWFFLKEEPHREWILEVVSTLRGIFYPNNFKDDL